MIKRFLIMNNFFVILIMKSFLTLREKGACLRRFKSKSVTTCKKLLSTQKLSPLYENYNSKVYII